MKLYINGKEFEVAENLSVRLLIDNFKLDIKSTAVAVNKEIVPKSGYAGFILKEDDKVDLVSIAPGG
ncbi:MAG: sulfur carrier protein ThiS [Deltaproteobacteria bacterium]|jgi:thiamine biosynthesis protein ThiS|nr:sulfur carrier protein ThiS [Deltaproteobacteria bacterium]MCL5880577.1 sulfur carrier protein ThiS [Deltaproteobacteria bacterium]MDA8304912.1 sulfur carrier protein ThiS [Deltaproteobacteria bacterium]